jgi:hypothetical protein
MPYAVQIEPDRRLRAVVVVCGFALQTLGIALLAGLALGLLPKLLLLASWIGFAGHELWRQWQGYTCIAHISIHDDGSLDGVDHRGAVSPLQILGGSFVLSHVAWLRLQFADGRHYGELICGNADANAGWHGLQLSWVQHGRRFGRVERS